MTRTKTTRVLTAALLVAGTSQAETSFSASAKVDKDTASAESESKSDADSKASEADAPAEEKKASASEEEGVLGPDLPYMKRYVPEGNMWELGLFGGVMFPSDSHDLIGDGNGDNQQGFKAAGVIGFRAAYFPLSFLGVEFEGAGMPSKAKDDTAAGLWAARGHLIAQLPGSSITPFLLAGGGALGAASDSMGSDVDASLNLGLGVKAALDEHVGIRFDLRDSLSQKDDAPAGRLTHHPEVLFGIVFTPERRKPDLDGDGLNDFRDECPREAGEFNGCPTVDTDGDGVTDDLDACPEVASTHPSGCLDSDGDGVEDSKDACPEDSGTGPGGCPEKECASQDADGDGIIDSADKCPNEAGDSRDGCPTKDQDGDGVPDDKDQCIDKPETVNGFQDEDGCPDEIPEEVKKFDGVMDGMVFELGSEKISPKSRPKLQETVAIMKEYPSLHVEISGHTDSTGDKDRNDKLSLARANSVKKYLTDEGIAAERIETKGFGPSKPIADNGTADGRSKNRRIEFHLAHK